jgi:hypothetical protein
MNSRLTLIGAALFAVGILLLVFSLNRVVKRIRYRDTGDKFRRPPKSPSLIVVILALVFIVFGDGFFWLSSQIDSFRPIGADGIIGRVQVERLDDPVKSLGVTYIPSEGNVESVPNLFYLSGDSWRFKGEIIDFKIANKYLNLPARVYKTTAFNGRFLERLPPNASGALLDENILEGGSSAAYRLFRDSRYFKWFAGVDSFAIDYITTAKRDSFIIRLEADGSLALDTVK